MSIKTNAHEDAVLNTMRATALAAWTPYIALFSAVADAEAGTVTDITASLGFARQSATMGAPAEGTGGLAGARVVANTNTITFGNATAGGTVTHIGVYDAATAGVLRYVIALSASKTINSGDPVSFPIGNLQIGEL